MRVVELDGHLVGEFAEVLVRFPVPADDVLNRRRDEQVFLLEPKFLPQRDVVVRVERARDVLRERLPLDGPDVVAVVEVFIVERLDRARRPQTEVVDGVDAVPRHRRVMRHRQHVLGVDPCASAAAVGVARHDASAAEADGHGIFRTRDLPGISAQKPGIRFLHLPAVSDHLVKKPEFVPQPVSRRRELQRRHGIEKARRESSEAAVAETGIRFQLPEILQLDAEGGQRVPARIVQTEIHQGRRHRPPREVLHGEVVDALRVHVVVVLLRPDPAIDQPVAHGHRGGQVPVVRRRRVPVLDERVLELVFDRELEALDVNPLVEVSGGGAHDGRALPPRPVPRGHEDDCIVAGRV